MGLALPNGASSAWRLQAYRDLLHHVLGEEDADRYLEAIDAFLIPTGNKRWDKAERRRGGRSGLGAVSPRDQAQPTTTAAAGARVSERLAFTVAEVAELTGLSTDRIYELCRRGEFPHVRIGERQILVPRRKLEQWLQGGDTSPDGVRSPTMRH